MSKNFFYIYPIDKFLFNEWIKKRDWKSHEKKKIDSKLKGIFKFRKKSGFDL